MLFADWCNCNGQLTLGTLDVGITITFVIHFAKSSPYIPFPEKYALAPTNTTWVEFMALAEECNKNTSFGSLGPFIHFCFFTLHSKDFRWDVRIPPQISFPYPWTSPNLELIRGFRYLLYVWIAICT